MRAGMMWVLLACALVACKKGEGEQCEQIRDECGEGLLCARVAKVQDLPICTTQATADGWCAKTEHCTAAGMCAFRAGVAGTCIATKPEHCEKSTSCQWRGDCSLMKEGRCDVASDADCKRSEACTKHGRCKYDRGGDPLAKCVAGD